MTLKITTFNVENMFNRYALLDLPWEERDYDKVVSAIGIASIASREGDLVSYETTAIQRNNTAKAILDVVPDILAVEEIENLYTIRNFNREYLDDYFDRLISIDGNDPRGIDVALCLRSGLDAEILNIRTHVDEPQKGKTVQRGYCEGGGYWVQGAIFSRDCLEVDIRIGKTTLTLLVNHLKAQDGSKDSVTRRQAQAQRVAEIAKAAADDGMFPIVLGDMNVPPGKDNSLDPLLKDNEILQDPFPGDPWTHYYAPKKDVSRLDYILPHKDLEVKDTEIFRRGLTTKCKQNSVTPYPTIGPQNTEASDHCPTSIVIEL